MIGFDARKSDFVVYMRTIKTQTSLCIHDVWSVPLLLAVCLKRCCPSSPEFFSLSTTVDTQADLCILVIACNEIKFSRDEAQVQLVF